MITSKLIFYWDSKYVKQSINRHSPIYVLIHCTFMNALLESFVNLYFTQSQILALQCD